MSRGFAFHPAARAELREAVTFYKGEAPGLGKDFVAEVRTTIDRIVEYPYAGSPVDPGVRRRLLARFPYSIVYLEDAEPVVIVAVMHQRRKPGYWLARVQER